MTRVTNPDIAAKFGDNIMVRSGPALAMGRGRLVGTFLEQCPDADALLMIDADMSFDAATIVAMVNAFEEMRETYENVGMLGGLAFISNDPRATQPVPNLWVNNPKRPGEIVKQMGYNTDTLYEVAGTGGACVIVAREVLEKLCQPGINPFHHVNLVNYPMLARNLSQMTDIQAIEAMVTEHVTNADQLGEDLSFCWRVKRAGYRIFVHTGLRFDHAKSILIGEPEFKAVATATEVPAQEAVA